MAFDFKKEFKQIYAPAKKPSIIEVPQMNYVAVRGKGDPNDESGEYKRAIELLYGLSYTLKMSYKGGRKIDGFFEYVVPPLEGLWWQKDENAVDYSNKDSFSWISLIRLPDFVTKEDFNWAAQEAQRKKKRDFSGVVFFPYDEGTCVQCMHIGPYDDEPKTVEMMHQFTKENGYCIDLSENRRHHEIYLSDPRKTASEKMRTVIRHPIKK